MNELVGGLQKQVKELTEMVTARFSSVDAKAVDAEKDKKIDEVLARMDALEKQKAVRKMVFGSGKASSHVGEERTINFKDFLRGVYTGDKEILGAIEKAANGQSEGTNADGGFSVPTDFASLIVAKEQQFGVAAKTCRQFPMGTLTRKVPRQLTQPTVTWTAEAVNHTKTKVALEQITQTAKKLSAVIPLTEELLADNNVNLDSFIIEVVAQAFAREVDRVAFAGNTGSGDAFMGVLNAASVNVVAMAGASLDYLDIVETVMTPKAPYRAGSVLIMSTAALKLCMKLVDNQNRPIWIGVPMEGGAPGTIMGYPYFETDQIPTNLGAGAQTAILFGPFSRHLWLSDRGTYDVKASDSASDANAGAGSAFLQDEVWYKFRKRMDITVAQPEAFARIVVS